MAIRHILDLSTDHLPDEWRDNPVAAPGVTAYPVDYGTLMWVPDDPDESATVFPDETVPENLLAIQRHARGLDCDYVLFDPDADRVDGLPVYSDQAAYVAAVRAAIDAGGALLLTPTCAECGLEPEHTDEASAHVMHGPHVIVGCEGYWMVNPAAGGVDAPNWIGVPGVNIPEVAP